MYLHRATCKSTFHKLKNLAIVFPLLISIYDKTSLGIQNSVLQHGNKRDLIENGHFCTCKMKPEKCENAIGEALLPGGG